MKSVPVAFDSLYVSLNVSMPWYVAGISSISKSFILLFNTLLVQPIDDSSSRGNCKTMKNINAAALKSAKKNKSYFTAFDYVAGFCKDWYTPSK